MSPKGANRASFHTILTVPAGSLTAIRGKSFIGKRLYPGMNAADRDVTSSLVWCAGEAQEAFGRVRQLLGTYVITSATGSVKHGPEADRFVPQLCSYATYTSPGLTSTAGYAPSFSQPFTSGRAITRYGGAGAVFEPLLHTGRRGLDLMLHTARPISVGTPVGLSELPSKSVYDM